MAKTKKSGEAKQSELPKTLKRSSDKAQRTFTKTYDAAIKEYDGDEERAYRTAYASLEKKYEKVGDKWKRKKDDDASDKKSKDSKKDKDKKEKAKSKDSKKSKDTKAKDKKSDKSEKSEKKDKKSDGKKDKKDKKSDKKVEHKVAGLKRTALPAELQEADKAEKSDRAEKSDKKKKSDKSDKKKSDSTKKSEKDLSVPAEEERIETEPSLLESPSPHAEIDDFMEEDLLDENLYGSADADVEPEPALETLREVEDLQDSAYPEDEISEESAELIEELSEQEEHQSELESQTAAFEVPGDSSSFTLENTTKRELYAEAIEREIPRRSAMNKEELFNAVKAARAQ